MLLAADQLTKRLFYDLRIGEDTLLLTPAFNTGIGRSLPVPLELVTVLTIIALGVLVRRRKQEPSHRFAMVLFGSGAVGNLLDRVLLNGVRDFIDFQVRPIFNLADCRITF